MTADNTLLLGPVQESSDGDTSNSSAGSTDGASSPPPQPIKATLTLQISRKKKKKKKSLWSNAGRKHYQTQATITQLFSSIKKSSEVKSKAKEDDEKQCPVTPAPEETTENEPQPMELEVPIEIDALVPAPEDEQMLPIPAPPPEELQTAPVAPGPSPAPEELQTAPVVLVPSPATEDLQTAPVAPVPSPATEDLQTAPVAPVPSPATVTEPTFIPTAPAVENLTQFIPANVEENMRHFLDGQNPSIKSKYHTNPSGFLIKNLQDIKLDFAPHFHLATQIGIKFNQKSSSGSGAAKKGKLKKNDFFSNLGLQSLDDRKTTRRSWTNSSAQAPTSAPAPESSFQLSGEWSHPSITQRIYICNVCGAIANNWWENVTHKGETHGGGVVVTHVEINKTQTPMDRMPRILGALVVKETSTSATIPSESDPFLGDRDPLMPVLEKQVDGPPSPRGNRRTANTKVQSNSSSKSKTSKKSYHKNTKIPTNEPELFLPYKCTKCSVSFGTQASLHHHIFQCSGELDRLFSDGETEEPEFAKSPKSPATSSNSSSSTNPTHHSPMKKSSKKIGGLIVYNYYQQEKFKNRINQILSKEREKELEEEEMKQQPKKRKRRKAKPKLVVRKYNGKYNR